MARLNKSQPALVVTMVTLLLVASTCLPARSQGLKGSEAAVGSGQDNSGRQLAMTSPGPKAKKNSKGEQSVQAVISGARNALVDQLESRNISVSVPEVDIPEDMEKTADACYKTVRCAVTFAEEHTAQFGAWFARYLKQLAGPPTVTPCGSPYDVNHRLVPGSFGQQNSKLYVTDEGRLKTVITR